MASYTTLPPPVYSEILPIVDLSPPPPQFQFKSIPNPNPPPSADPSPIYLSPPPPPLSSTSYYSPPPTPDLSSPLTPMASPPLPSYDTPPPLYVPPPPLPPPALPPAPLPAAAPPISPPPPLSPPPPVPVPPRTAVSTRCPPSPPSPVPVPPPTAISGPPPQPVPPPPPVPVTPPIVSPSPRILPKPPLPSSTPPPPTPPIHSLPSQPRAPSTVSPLPLSVPSPSLLGRPNSSNFTSNGRIGLKDSSSRNNGIANGATASVAALLGFMMLSVVGVAVWLVRKRKRLPASSGFVTMSQPGGLSAMSVSTYPRFPSARDRSGSYGFACSPSDSSLGNSKLWFIYEDLSMFTNGFSAQNILGEGGFGPVYKGQLPNGRLVAVKQLKVGGSQGEREFRAEVEIISRVHHRHLVSLVGYCISEHQKLHVYDYVPNNTLHYHLHGKGMPVMDWATRVKVAAGAARGIAYLHEDCHPRIIHRDIKSSNILLDNNFEAQVSDFGLARLAMDACTHVTTRVMGTFGYLAPEYASTGKLTAKSDVYSFGVVLLELITGRKPVDVSQPLGDESLVEWARPLLSHALEKGEIGELPDPRLEERYNRKEIFCMIEAAASCVRHSAAMRPRMGQVVRALANLVDSDLTNGVRPGKSEEFNSGPNSEEIETFQRTRFSSQDYSGNFS